MNNVRRESREMFQEERREYLKDKIHELEKDNRQKTSATYLVP
jgi:uncharacterized protein YydD (DUF2326 family)